VKKPLSPRSERESLWATALRAAAAVTRHGALTEEDVVRAVSEGLRRLQLTGAVTLMTPDGRLVVKSRPVSPAIATTLHRLTGTEIIGFAFHPEKADAYRQALATGEAVYCPHRSTVIAQMVPQELKALLPRIIHLLGEMPVIIAPIALAGKTLGAMNVAARWLTPADAPMVAALADHAAVALGNARARAEMQAALERERLRNQVAEIIASGLELEAVLDRVLRLAADVSRADSGALAILAPDGQSLSFQHVFGLPESLKVPNVPRGRGLTWRVIENREAVLLVDYRASPHAIPAWIEAGIRSTLGVPLIVGEEVVGAIGLFSQQAGSFEAGQVEMVQAIARMAAVAIRNSRSLAESSRRSAESQALIRSAGAISASLDLQTVLTEISKQAKDLFRADGSRIHLLDPERGVLRCLVAIQPDAEAVKAIELRPGQGLTGYVLESGEAMIVNDASRHPRGFHVAGTPEEDPEVMLLAPLKVRQRTMGVMTVLRFSYDRPFQQADLELLNPFAIHAALAIENAHLYGQIEKQAHRLEAEVISRTRDLALSEARYRALVETSLAGILQLDLQGHIVYANQALAELLGYSSEELVGLARSEEGAHFALGTMIVEEFSERLRGDRPAREVYEIELTSRDGRRIPALVAVSLIRDGDRNPQGITALVLDISHRKALEAALQSESDRLNAILTNIGDAVMVTDPQGRIEYVNPAWERLNGYGAREVAGLTARVIQSGKHPREFYTALWEIILSGESWQGEIVNRRKDSTLYEAAVTIAPIKNDEGRIVNFVGVQHDISALKEIDRMKSQFVSDVSHELRTPLTNIRLYLDLLRAARDPSRTGRYLETMDRESERLAHLIDDLLSLSRLDAGTVTLNPAKVDINHLLTALVDDRQALAGNRGLHLNLDCAPDIPRVMGDERLLTQVFTNLLSNALNYTPSGGSVTMRTRVHRSDERDFVIAQVEDTGFGIPPEEQPMLFRRFFRGQSSRITGAAGTGLGLAICKEILDRHEGRIEVESKGTPGDGSRFTVWLPATPGS
jgi:PAS domain S-box-containing protein